MRKNHVLLTIFLSLTLFTGVGQPAAIAKPLIRLIYFLPNDRPPQPDINTKLDRLIKDVQRFYANEMQRHGYGWKTFAFETDGHGNAVVHRVKGLFADAYYHTNTFDKLTQEISPRFDIARSIYLIVIETSELIDGKYCGMGSTHWHHGHIGGSAIITTVGECFDAESGVGHTAHELGHAFLLHHDFRNDAYLMSYGANRTELSACAAAWLDAYRYFNPGPPTFDTPTTLQMLPLETVNPFTFRFRFSVFDPDGLHQAQLLTKATAVDPAPGYLKLIACQSLSGTHGQVDILTRELLSETVMLQVIDVHGNFQFREFQLNIAALPQLSKVVSIGDANLSAAIRETLGLQPLTDPTQQDLLRLTQLKARNRNIRNLTGLEAAYNLKSLDLGSESIAGTSVNSNRISGVSPLSGLTDLTHLMLSNTAFSDVSSLSKVPQLTWLSLGFNNISDVSPLSGLTDLTHLVLFFNNISDVSPLSKMHQLTWLDLRSNQISDVSPLSDLPELTTLILWNNPLSFDSIHRHIPALQAKGIDVKFDDPKGAAAPALPHQNVPLPKRTQLLVNYPNPFNPETWIPYQLAEDTQVSISIYDTTGRLVRTLSLGFQSAGFYNSQGRAAYWDGRNAVGEPVASGIYFYTLTAGDFTATRKLLIVK